MTRTATLVMLINGLAATTAVADEATAISRSSGFDEPQREEDEEHDSPLLKLAYRRFAIANSNGTPIWLDGGQMDVYALSTRWMRIGLEVEGGAGRITTPDATANLSYALGGLSIGFQYPARVTPFVEARFAGGVIGGRFDNTVSLGSGATATGSYSALTWLIAGGVEAGVEVYTVGRAYLSAAIGWVRTTWRSVDTPALLQSPGNGLQLKDLTGDAVTLKIGFGI